MEIALNGEEKTVRDGLSVEELLKELDLDPSKRGIAIAVNGEVVPRDRWRTTPIRQGDRVDMINVVQGG